MRTLTMEELMSEDSCIISLVEDQEEYDSFIFDIPKERVIGRVVKEWLPYCGTYGQGGPGFLGFHLEAEGLYPEEFLILRLWAAADWLEVNRRWLSFDPEQLKTRRRPLFSNRGIGRKWDEFAPLIVGKCIRSFVCEKKSMRMRVGDASVVFSDNPSRRPPHMDGQPRILHRRDDLRKAWFIAPFPWVKI